MIARFVNWLARKSAAYRMLEGRALLDSKTVEIFGEALSQIAEIPDTVKIANGTTRKAARIAREAYQARYPYAFDAN